MKIKFDRWKWETTKMFVYVFFPVAVFTYFSDPTVYEKDLIKLYKMNNVPENQDDMRMLEEVKEKARKKRLDELRAKVQKQLSGSV